MPKLDMMTTQQVADYYEVSFDSVKKCYQRNRAEIDEDGTKISTPTFLKGHFVPIETKRGKTVFKIAESITLEVPNRGIRMFSKRAIQHYRNTVTVSFSF